MRVGLKMKFKKNKPEMDKKMIGNKAESGKSLKACELGRKMKASSKNCMNKYLIQCLF